MFLPLLIELRRHDVRVGLGEAMALARALSLGLHGSSLEGFYRLARALCVHREADLDAFDQAFGVCFRGLSRDSAELTRKLEEWLKDPREGPALSAELLEALERLEVSELRRLFEQRMREQDERHDGGQRWIGTGGTSPIGTRGVHPTGVNAGAKHSGGGRGAVAMADARAYRPYRSDRVLDVRQVDVALRRLRSMGRDPSRLELDLDETIDRTAQGGGELEIVLRSPKRSNARVLLLMDVGGSMDPHIDLVTPLFSAAKRASHFRELKTLYFHNCVYSRLYETDGMRGATATRAVLEHCTREWKLVIVGDAAMHPQELYGGEWLVAEGEAQNSGLQWMQLLADHFERRVWLNPDPPRYWQGGTAEKLAESFPMFPLTLDGLTAAMAHLSGARPPPRKGEAGNYSRTSM